VTAADVLNDALLHGSLAQLVKRGRGTALLFGRLARQRQQLQPLHVTDSPRPPGTLGFAQSGHPLAHKAAAPLRYAGQRHNQ